MKYIGIHTKVLYFIATTTCLSGYYVICSEYFVQYGLYHLFFVFKSCLIHSALTVLVKLSMGVFHEPHWQQSPDVLRNICWQLHQILHLVIILASYCYRICNVPGHHKTAHQPSKYLSTMFFSSPYVAHGLPSHTPMYFALVRWLSEIHKWQSYFPYPN